MCRAPRASHEPPSFPPSLPLARLLGLPPIRMRGLAPVPSGDPAVAAFGDADGRFPRKSGPRKSGPSESRHSEPTHSAPAPGPRCGSRLVHHNAPRFLRLSRDFNVTSDRRIRSKDNQEEGNPPRNEPTQEVMSLSLKIVSFDELAEGKTEIWIELDQQHYRLRRTRSDKLVLTK